MEMYTLKVENNGKSQSCNVYSIDMINNVIVKIIMKHYGVNIIDDIKPIVLCVLHEQYIKYTFEKFNFLITKN